MALFPTLVTEDGRRLLIKLLTAFPVICGFISLCLIVYGVYLLGFLYPYTKFIDSAPVRNVGLYVLFGGILLIALDVFVGYVVYECRQPRKREEWLPMMSGSDAMLMLSVCLVIPLIFILITIEIVYLEQSTKSALLRAIDRHGKESREYKSQVMDYLQVNYKCCGSIDYSDYFHNNWDPIQLNILIDGNKKKVNQSVPYSCCNMRHEGPCNVHFFGTTKQKNTARDSIYWDLGCALAFSSNIGFYMTVADCFWCLLWTLTVVIYLVHRYLHTSLDNAVDANETRATTYGYILAKSFLFDTPLDPEIQAKMIEEAKVRRNRRRERVRMKAKSATPSSKEGDPLLPRDEGSQRGSEAESVTSKVQKYKERYYILKEIR